MSRYTPFLLGILFVLVFWVIVLSSMPKHSVVVYDCRLAEISPDFPLEVREQCRKQRAKI